MKKNCSGKCSYKIKTNNNNNKRTNERPLLLVDPQTKNLQLN